MVPRLARLLIVATLALAISTASSVALAASAWVVADVGVYAIDLERQTLAPLIELPGIRLHAAESESVHWLVVDTTLIRVDITTRATVRYEAAALGLVGVDAIAVDPLRGGIWVVDGRTVNVIATDGSLLARNDLGARVLALAFDADGDAWAMTADSINRFGPADRIVDRWVLADALPHASTLIVDPYHDVVWAKVGANLVRIDIGEALPRIQTYALGSESALLLWSQTGTLQAISSMSTRTFSYLGETSERAMKSAARDQGPLAAFVDPTRGNRIASIFSDRVTLSGGVDGTVDVAFPFRASQASVVPILVRPVLRIVQPPDGVVIERPLPSLVAVAAQDCGLGDCPLPAGYWTHHNVSVEINGDTSQDQPMLDTSTSTINLASMGDLEPGANNIVVSLRGRDQRVTARATTDFEITAKRAGTGTQIGIKSNSLPAVTLTAPAAGTVFIAPATIAMAATAIDSDGTITRVDFFKGATLLGTDTTKPYAYSWTAVPAGTYTLAAKATDNAGGSTTSATVSVVVNAPPTAKITAPVTGAVFTAPANITITATATDSDGTISKVDYYAGATLIGTDTSSPYTLVWNNVAAGTYSLTVKATDNRGSVATSAAVSVIVNKAPTVVLTAPLDGALYGAPATILLQATASDTDGTISKVDFYNGATKIGTKTTSPYTFSWTNVGVGSYTLTAKATDNRGGLATSAAVHVNVIAAPTIYLTTPTSGAISQEPGNILLSANATNPSGTITKVEFFVGATLLATVAQSPYQYAWLNVVAGSYNLTAKVTTDRGLTRVSGAVAITVSPMVALAVTVDSQGSVNGDSTTVSGTVQAPANSSIIVNNTPALVGDDGVFYADNVPLTAGNNSISVVINSLDGRSLTNTFSLQATGTPAPVTLTARPSAGVAPLTTTLRIVNATGAVITKVEFDPFGIGGFQDQYAIVDRVTATYSWAGTYRPQVRLTDDQDRQYVAVTTIVVRDATTLDQMFQGMWSGMNDALAAGNLTAANRYLNADAQAKFGSVFTDLNGRFPSIIASYGQFWLHQIDHGYAEYALVRNVRGTDKLFMIYFLLDNDGSWRIGEM